MRNDLGRTTLTRMRGLRIACVISLLAAACSGRGSHAELVAAPPSATASTRSVPSPAVSAARPSAVVSPTAPPPGPAPLSAGAVADAGVLYVWGRRRRDLPLRRRDRRARAGMGNVDAVD